MKDGRMRVGIFDSGIGGLSVLRACTARAAGIRYYYYGDNGNAPYGSRPAEEIASLVRRGLSQFARLGADAAVLACNTATAVCIEEMRREFSFPLIGVEPAVKPAAERYASALVLATPRTAESARLAALVARFPDTRFRIAALPHLAEAIEAALPEGREVDLAAHLPADDSDCVVLGCTHYALISGQIGRFYGKPTLDGSVGTADSLMRLLKIGQNIHERPHSNHAENGGNFIKFLGNSKTLNKKVYFTNKCFQ